MNLARVEPARTVGRVGHGEPTNTIGCAEYSAETVDALRGFRDTYRGEGPEDVPL